jgi:hypothetical protein
MFGGKSHILRGSVSLALIVLILLVIILLVSEENPLRDSLFEVKRQFSSSSSSSSSGIYMRFTAFSIHFFGYNGRNF